MGLNLSHRWPDQSIESDQQWASWWCWIRRNFLSALITLACILFYLNMNLLLNILCGIFILIGIPLLVSPVRGAALASITYILSGILAYEERSYIYLIVGFSMAWVIQKATQGK
ncbi:MAG: hypothetical protein ACKOWD_09970 [Rhodoferax sp.]